MDITKTITLTSVGIIAFAVSLTLTQLLIRKEKNKSENESKILLAYGILFSSWVISVLFVGLTNTWLIIWYFITKALSLLFTGKRNDVNEIENNNYVYFILKGVVFIGFVYSLMPVYEIVLRTFFPNIEIPYYR